MTAFDDRLSGDRKRLMLFATIQGVENIFKERGVALSVPGDEETSPVLTGLTHWSEADDTFTDNGADGHMLDKSSHTFTHGAFTDCKTRMIFQDDSNNTFISSVVNGKRGRRCVASGGSNGLFNFKSDGSSVGSQTRSQDIFGAADFTVQWLAQFQQVADEGTSYMTSAYTGTPYTFSLVSFTTYSTPPPSFRFFSVYTPPANGGTVFSSSGAPIHLVTLVKSGTTVRCYIDDDFTTPIATITGAPSGPSTTAGVWRMLGASAAQSPIHLALLTYNVALTSDELTQNANYLRGEDRFGPTAFGTPPAGTTYFLGEERAEYIVIPKGGVDQGEETIDYEQLAQVGGGLKLKLQQPRGTTILEDVFRSQARRVAFLTDTSVSKTATSFEVSDTTAFGDVDDTVTLYMGSETIRARIASSTEFDTAERGMFGSRAQIHNGSSTNGTAIYDVPPTMLGRRVALYGAFLKDDGLTTTAGLVQLIGTFAIDENPKWKDNTLTLDCGPVIDELLARNCYVGVEESNGGAMYRPSNTSSTWYIEVNDAKMFRPSDYFFTHALIKIKGGHTMLAKIIENDEVLNRVEVDPVTSFISGSEFSHDDPLIDSQTSPPRPGFAIDSVRHVAMLGGNGPGGILTALLSMRGDVANGGNDTLPGIDRSAFGEDDYRFGAGIDASDVDTSAFAISSVPWLWFLDDTAQVKTLIRDWCLLANRFVFGTTAGRLSTKTLSEERVAATFTVSDSVRARSMPIETYVDESAIHPILRLRASYSPVDGEFKYNETHVDAELVKRHEQRGEPYKIEIRGLGVQILDDPLDGGVQTFRFPGAIRPGVAGDMARRWQSAGGRGRLIAKVPCSLRALAVSLGDVVDIDVDGKDYDGGSIRGRVGRVIGRRPQYDEGRCDLTLHVLEDVFVLAPSAVITALSTTTLPNDTITLSTTDPVNDSATPADHFPVGLRVRIWDVSAGTSQARIVAASTSPGTLRFTSGVSGSIEAGVDWITWNTLSSGNAGLTSASGVDEDDILFQMADTGIPLDGEVRRWR